MRKMLCLLCVCSDSLCWRNDGSRAKERGKIPQHSVKSRVLHTTQFQWDNGAHNCCPILAPCPSLSSSVVWPHSATCDDQTHFSCVCLLAHSVPFVWNPIPLSCPIQVLLSLGDMFQVSSPPPPGVGPLLMIPIPRPPQRSTVSIEDPCCMISSSDLPVPHWSMTSFPAPCMVGRSMVQGMKQEHDINH